GQRAGDDSGRHGAHDLPVHRMMEMMRAHAGERRKYDRRHRGGEREVHHVLGGESLGRENEYQHRHHHHAAADAEQPSEKTHRHTNSEIGPPPLHQRPPTRCAASSANPPPAAARVTYFGGVGMCPANRATFATPTERSKKENIGASFGESPAKANSR